MTKLPIIFSYENVEDLFKNKDDYYYFISSSLKKGKIKQIKRGLYTLVDPSTNEIYVSKLQIACSFYKDCFISYHEALEYYGLATQSYISVCTSLSHLYISSVVFNGVEYRIKKNLCKLQVEDHSIEEKIRVTSIERTFVDCIDNISLGGGLDEIIAAIKNSPKLNLDKILEILKVYNKKYLYIKVGYLFESYLSYEIDSYFIKKCKSYITNKRYYLDKSSKNNKLVSKWNLLVPVSIGEQINELY